ncbi:hypothetical protein GCM10010289_85520 [Streptomyces violascens]|nr:hypothetical protein GCM10010289_85520 [Streptomyces violascens]
MIARLRMVTMFSGPRPVRIFEAISHTEDLPRLERQLRASDSGRAPWEVPLDSRQSKATR